jgi:hypothetical protein
LSQISIDLNQEQMTGGGGDPCAQDVIANGIAGRFSASRPDEVIEQ